MREKSFDSINVVPFIDIMLVLLTIVLATATFIKSGQIPVKLPTEAKSDAYVESPSVVITGGGDFMFGGRQYSLEELSALFDVMDKSTVITVQADREAQIQPFADLMTLLKDKGFQSISLKTEVKK